MQTQVVSNVTFSEQSPTQPASIDWLSFLTGEILAAGLLSRMLYHYPTREWLQTLVDEDIFSDAPLGEAQPDVQNGLALLQQWTHRVSADLSLAAVDDIRADYTHLMVGTDLVLAPPWESVYFSEERLIFSEQTTLVRQWYQRFGLQVERHQQEPEDHIGLELAFVAHLAREALVAVEQGDSSAFEYFIASQREFLSRHLLNWAFSWCDLVSHYARTDYFRGVALLTRGILTEISTTFGLTINPS